VLRVEEVLHSVMVGRAVKVQIGTFSGGARWCDVLWRRMGGAGDDDSDLFPLIVAKGAAPERILLLLEGANEVDSFLANDYDESLWCEVHVLGLYWSGCEKLEW